jgi:DeoR/GlpR family transcriptional regulator of sugar metabolism
MTLCGRGHGSLETIGRDLAQCSSLGLLHEAYGFDVVPSPLTGDSILLIRDEDANNNSTNNEEIEISI